MSILIKNGTVVNDDAMLKADVLIKDGIIVDVAPNITAYADKVIDAEDKLVIPGGIDPHTHLEEPFMGEVTVDDFFTGTAAAVSGGTTMIIDFVIPSKQETLLEAYEMWRRRADPKVVCDYGLSMAVTSWSPLISQQMEIVTTPEYGINSFKFFMAFAGVLMIQDEEFYHAMKRCSKLGALARVHAENGAVILEKEKELLAMGITGPEGHILSRPEELQEEATSRACFLAQQANCPLYVVHVMSKGAANAISQHRARGTVVFGEPVAASLALDGSHYFHHDWLHAARYVMSPPLSRDPTTPDTLMDYLAAGILHLTATDNCTFDGCQKALGRDDFTKIPNGINGVEDRMSVVWHRGVNSGKMDAMRFVAVTSSTAAKIFNIYPKKGRIAIGSDADVVIWNPKKRKVISKETHHQAVDFNIFEGMDVEGVAEITISRGNIVWEDGVLCVERGAGSFVSLPTHSPYVYNAIRRREQVQVPQGVKRKNK